MPPNNHKPHENKELQLFNELFRSHYSLLHNYILKISIEFLDVISNILFVGIE